ncbi:hypothetical protein FQZ97_800920 [compost metagenome]
MVRLLAGIPHVGNGGGRIVKKPFAVLVVYPRLRNNLRPSHRADVLFILGHHRIYSRRRHDATLVKEGFNRTCAGLVIRVRV